jgi:elongation factor G
LPTTILGKLTRQTSLLNANRNQKEKVSKLLLLYASETEEVDELPFGSVGVVLGLKHTRTGDTLVSSGVSDAFKSTLRDIRPPPAVVSASVIPQSHSEIQAVQNALDALTRTDPSVRVETQEGQMLVHGLGSLHLEIVEGRLRDEWKVNFEFGRRRVSYREGLGCEIPAPDWNVWKTEIAGKPITVTVPLSVRGLEPQEMGDPVWDGNVVLDEKGRPIPSPDGMPTGLLTDVAIGVLNGLSNSPHSSLPMSKLHVQIHNLRHIESKVSSLVTGASAAVLRKRIRDAGLGPIMEPFIQLRISVGENQVGKIVKDLTERGGELLDMENEDTAGDGKEKQEVYSEDFVYLPPDWISPSGTTPMHKIRSEHHLKRTVQALAPLSQFLDFSSRLRAMTEGHGVFEMSGAGFREVSEERRLEILREIGRA